MGRKALIVVNRRGTGGRRSLDRVIHQLEDAGLDVSGEAFCALLRWETRAPVFSPGEKHRRERLTGFLMQYLARASEARPSPGRTVTELWMEKPECLHERRS